MNIPAASDSASLRRPMHTSRLGWHPSDGHLLFAIEWGGFLDLLPAPLGLHQIRLINGYLGQVIWGIY